MPIATDYFHGGVPGLVKGNMILPPSITGAPSCSEFGAEHVHRRDRVYLTTKPAAALIFAVTHPSGDGCVYRCTPVGTLEPDPDSNVPGLSVQCERARVVHVHKITPSARRLLLKRLVEEGVLPKESVYG